MKYLILFLLSFNLHAKMRVEAFNKVTGKYETGYYGESATIDGLKQKMSAKGLNPNDYNITIVDMEQEKAASIQKSIDKQAEMQEIKSMVQDINNSSKPAWEKKMLRVLVRELR